MGEDGFEPSKRYAADLQSVPFGHSGTPPYEIIRFVSLSGAGRRTRTPDLLITVTVTTDFFTIAIWGKACLFFEQLGGYGFRQRVIALLLVPRYEVISVLPHQKS